MVGIFYYIADSFINGQDETREILSIVFLIWTFFLSICLYSVYRKAKK
jgi:hypothetical protein